ncbi:hypothetical protein [Rosistilla oblonga]|uniref:hypothetical protein n=1 Tax=Rosistilla oblonga TaxID=2527990 RepID=UPI003A96A5DE
MGSDELRATTPPQIKPASQSRKVEADPAAASEKKREAMRLAATSVPPVDMPVQWFLTLIAVGACFASAVMVGVSTVSMIAIVASIAFTFLCVLSIRLAQIHQELRRHNAREADKVLRSGSNDDLKREAGWNIPQRPY